MTDLPQILIGELGRTMGMFLAWVWMGRLLKGNIAKVVIYDQARVIGGNNSE